MKQRWVLLIFLIGVCLSRAYAQEYPITQITINDGLPQSVVYSIMQDSKGFLWFATQDGVGKFDGISFANYSVSEGLLDNMARDVAEDIFGNIWIATDSGVSIILADDDSKIVTVDELSNLRVRTLYPRPDSTVWVGVTDMGIYQVKDFRVIQHLDKKLGLVSNRVYALEFDINNTLYAGTEDGLSVYYNGSFKNYTTKDGLLSNRIRDVKLIENTKLWIAGYGGGITEFSQGKFKKYSKAEGFPSIKINKLIQRKNGSIVMASDGNGVYIYNGKTVEHIAESKGIKNGSLQSVYEDQEQNLWLGTWGSGVYRLRYLNILQYDINSGLPENNVTAVTVDPSGAIWMGTNNMGISRFYKGEKTYYNTGNGKLPVNRIFDLTVASATEVWAATDRGLFKIDKNGINYHEQLDGLSKASIRRVTRDKNNRIWSGVFGNGLFVIDGKSVKQFSRKDGLLNDSVFAISHRKNGETWVGTDGGISIIKGDKVVRSITKDNGIKDNRIANLLEDSHGNMWVGTFKNGLDIFKDDTLIHYDITNGLSNNLITFMEEDQFGSVWVGTKKGINRFYTDRIVSYSTMNGIISNETNVNSSYYKHPYMFIGTVDGTSQLDLSSEIFNNQEPPVYITAVKNLDKHLDLQWLNELNFNQNNLTFEFTGINFTNPTQLKFRYRLVGFDNLWRTTTKRSIQFTNLPDGHYTFEVLALNSFGLYSEQPAQLHFTIIPPFWITKSFRIIVFSLIVFVIYIGVRMRDRRLRQMNEELEIQIVERTKALKKSEELFRLISENAGELIAVCKLRGETVYASPSFEDLLGYHPKEIEGNNIAMLTNAENQAVMLDVVKRIKYKPEQIISEEVRLQHKDGHWIDFVTTTSAVQIQESDEMQYVILGHDISSRKRSEEELLKSKMQAEEANLAKSRFLASMSHELRTPLNAILGFAQIMANATDIPQKHREYVKIMHNSGEHLLSMINDILDLSKIEAGRMELKPGISSLHDFLIDLENMMQMQARKNNLALIFEQSEHVPDLIEVDFNKMRQVLINLIGNAIKYTEKGNVWVFTKLGKSGELEFQVRDTGPGIEPEQLSKIFDAFHQVNGNNFSKGTGLGLTISMKLAVLMGGNIHVESKHGSGSVFTLKLPYKSVANHEVMLSNSDKYHIKGLNADSKAPKVMIIDDVDENRAILTEYLSQVGFECYDYTLAKPALSAIDEVKPDIILTDIIMPEMNGKEFLVEIRNNPKTKKMPVIAITASIFAETRTDLIQFGFDEFIHKPIEMQTLLEMIAKFTHVSYERVEKSELIETKNSSNQYSEELSQLNAEQKEELAEALELLDMEQVQEFVKSLPEHLNLKKHLQLALDEKNYRFILSLSEQLNA
ncbi:PAS domain S-box protein [bacterium]|nr:MAG: PAS domain S-box protein [bacterium]